MLSWPRQVRYRRALTLVALAGALLVAACGGEGERDEDSGRLSIVATTSVIGEFAARVAGADASVTSLVPPGVDLHSFEPSPRAVRRIAEADLVLVNGYGLEGGLLEVVTENLRDGAGLIVVTAGLVPLGRSESAISAGIHLLDRLEGDPHFWLSVPNAIGYVERIAEGLALSDPDHAAGYRDRAEAYVRELRAVDAEAHAILDQVPADQRRLVVFHDAFGYLARDLGFAVSEAVLPANAIAEVSAARVAEVIELIDRAGIRAIYREPQFGSTLIDVIAAETGARVLTLRSVPDDEVTTYVELVRTNARALAEGLSPSLASAAAAD